MSRYKALLGLSVVLCIAGGLYYYKQFSSQIYIDPLEYSQFNKRVPISPDNCNQEAEIGYYHYEKERGEVANNKFGLYIYPDNEKFIDLADKLVNSNEGDWGYVLVPYNLQDKDAEKWRRVFFLLNKKHLIPVVQLWNINPEKYESQTDEAVEFLNQFIWPIKTRYISVYNEPNAADFWYGYIDPKEYAQILDYTIDTFKDSNSNYFVMNGAMNVSATQGYGYMDAFNFLTEMNIEVPGIFSKLDGWASHSYPQPNFSGRPTDTGRNSIRAYETELSYLRNNLGVSKDLPVFITETGWAHDAGKTWDSSYLPLETISNYFEQAYKDVWLPDDKVVAVMPFTIWYAPPADHFAWVDSRWVPYEHFQKVKSLKKVAGNPEKLTVATTNSVGCD
jgi:hypothetical protein